MIGEMEVMTMTYLKNILLAVFVLASILGISACGQDEEITEVLGTTDSYVTIDINPSINLVVSPAGIVIYVAPLNEDGELLLLELDLIGLTLEEATDLIIAQAIVLGFIDVDSDEVIVKINVMNIDDLVRDRVRDRVKEHINNAFLKRAMMGRAEDKVFDPELIAEAEGYGVTPGFLFLAKRIVELNDELILEDVLLMTQEELIGLMNDAKDAAKEVAQALKEQFFAARQVLLDTYLPQIEALNDQIALATGDELDALLIQLEALEQALHDEMFALREQFHAESAVLHLQMRLQHQARVNMHHQKVQDFLDTIKERKEERQDEIEEYQGRGKGRP